MSPSEALAVRLRLLAVRARRLPPPDHRNPEAFHEARDELGADIERLARAIMHEPGNKRGPTDAEAKPQVRRRQR